MPVIATFPELVAKMLADESRFTPVENVLVPHEVPLIVSEPVLTVTVDRVTETPQALSVPHAVPVIFTGPVPEAEISEKSDRETPLEIVVVPHDVPLTVIEPELVVALELLSISTPMA